MPGRTWTRSDVETVTTRAHAGDDASTRASTKRQGKTWTREGGDDDGTRAAKTPKLRAEARAFEPATQKAKREALEAKLRAVEREKAALREALERAAREKAEKKEREAAKVAETARRKVAAGNLLSGFRGVRKTVEDREEKLAKPVENVSPEEIERRAVRRVQLAGTDWQVLDLPPGSQKKWIVKNYRDLAKILHPDKCSAPGAKEAFQKLNKAYKALSGG
ncbi:RBJ protein [Ostreococcus tauri]|uniref:RBJ protein n=1 Tax=Ostreococcus tauri TaxID=70448 RepID=A0A1Y5IJD8_OSTTA|nr:RBJ protein [Ostreococcus tauri]